MPLIFILLSMLNFSFTCSEESRNIERSQCVHYYYKSMSMGYISYNHIRKRKKRIVAKSLLYLLSVYSWHKNVCPVYECNKYNTELQSDCCSYLMSLNYHSYQGG